MGAITLPNFRTTADVRMNTKLKDGGVYIEWSSLTEVKAWIWSDAQKALAGRVDVSVDTEDATVLKCLYASTKPQYPGVNRLIVQGRYNGSLKTYDKPVFNFVPRTAEATGSITISDPEVDVEIEVTDTTSSILDNTIAAALAAAAHAEHAASLVPLQVLQDCEAATAVALTAASKAPVIGENGNWWVWNSQQAAYVDTGKQAKGDTGNGIASFSVVESQEDDADNVVTVEFTDGTTETFNVKNGKTGNGIASIVQTVESPDDAGTNVITVTMTDGTVITFNVKNGSKGQPGAAQAAYKSVETLPTASAETMDKIYLTPSGTSGVYNMSYTDYDGSAYSWVNMGTTAIQLSDYATKAEFSQLEAEVTDLDEDVNGKPKNYSEGHYLKNDGTIGDNASYGLTDFIPYTSGNAVLWKFNNANGSYWIGFYRADKTYISGSDISAQYNAQNGGRLITVADINRYAPNAAYIRASFTLAFTGAEVIVGDTSAWTPQEKQPSLQEQIDALQIETEEVRQIAEDAENSLYVDGQKVVVADYITGNVLSTGECRNIGTASGYGFTYIPVSQGKQYHISGTFRNTAGTYAGIVFNETMLTTGAFATVVDMGVASGTINYDYVPESDGYLFAFSGNAVFTEKTQEDKYLRGDSVFSHCLQSPLKLVGVADSKMYVPMDTRTVKEGTTYRSFVIPVSNGDKYRVRGKGQVFASYAVIAFATSLTIGTHAEVFLSVSQNDSGYVYDTIVNIPADGYLIVFTNTLTYGSAAYVEILPMLDRITIDNDYYLPDSFKLQTFGDSITDSSWGDLSSWVNYVPDNIPIQGLTIVNSGIGGFSFAGLQNLMENGGTNSGGGVAPALQNDVDMITIFLGTNDWSAGVAIDSVKASFKNALGYFFANNKAKVLVCTPLQRYSTTTDVDRETNADGEMLNSAGYTLRELCDMIIKVCGMYSVPVLDLNAEALINKFNIMDYSGDGLHPNRCGDIYVSRLICKKIKEMLRN